MRYPGKPDLLLNLGNKFGERAAPGTRLISIRLDPASLARGAAGRSRHGGRSAARDRRPDRGDPRHGDRRKAQGDRAERFARTAAYTKEMREFRQQIVKENADRSPVSLERIGLELEAALDKDACFVGDIDSGRTIEIGHVVRRRRQEVFRHRPERARLGHGGGFRSEARAPEPAGGRGRRRRQLPVQWCAAAVDAGALQGADHEHRAQQQELQQRAQPHLALSAAASSKSAAT